MTIKIAARRPFTATRMMAPVVALLAVTSPTSAMAQQAIYPVIVPEAPDPLLTGLAIPANAATAGMWSRAIDWPIVAIHSAVLPDGRVLTFGAPPGGDVQDGRTLVYWDPRKGVGAAAFQVMANVQNVDSFCASATLLSDGRLLTSGGASNASGFSSFESMVLDWKTSTVTRDVNLTAPRWYSTMTKLADGRAIMTGGGVPYTTGFPDNANISPDISSTPEIYTPGQGWRSLIGAYSTDAFGGRYARWWYPRQWVTAAGTVFGISSEKMWEMRVDGNGSIRTLGNYKTPANDTTRPNMGPTSTAVMYDTGKILQAGGNGYHNGYKSVSSENASIIDIARISQGVVNVTDTGKMANGRQWANAVVLPNGRVLVVGGSRWADDAGANAVLASEIWNPATGTWTAGASETIYRGYHSTAILLPDGLVLVAGGGVPGPVTNRNAEIYYPPYLFRQQGAVSVLAARPRIVSLSTVTAGFNRVINAQVATGDDVSEVSLIAVASDTHSFDANQRRMRLPFARSASGVTIVMPVSGNLAPPGYYQLSIVNAAGVPSIGTIVSLGAAAPAAPGQVGTVAGGTVIPVAARIGGDAATIAAGQDGTVATANVRKEAWVLPAGRDWVQLPGTFTDIAAIGADRYYGIGTDAAVYRWAAGKWTRVGGGARAISAAADGTVAIAAVDSSSIWVKADDDQERWTQVPGAKADDIAVLKRGSLYYIDAASIVWRSDMVNPPVRVGEEAVAIAASSDGTVTVVGRNGTLWRKAADNNDAVWARLPGTASGIATPSAQVLVTIDETGAIMRR